MTIKKDHILTKVRGQVLIIAIIFLAVILIISATLFSKVASFLRFGAISVESSQATALAEAGIDNAVWQLNQTAGSYSGETNTPLGTTGTFTVTITNNPSNPNVKTIKSTGYIPNAASPRRKISIKVVAQIDSQSISFHFANQTGTGGVILNQSATINGNIYSNGNITAGNGNQQAINGDAFAVGAISPGILISGAKNPGASPMPFPTVDYDYWKNKAANSPTSQTINCSTTSALCTIGSSTSIGFKKYVGDLTINNNAIVTMAGPIWVAKDGLGNGGNFSMSQGGTTLKLDDSFGSNSTVLIADGIASLNQGGQFQPTSASPPGYIMLVTTSTDSRAINLTQNGATAIFYALDGGAILSQTANVTSLVAKQLTMSNSATLQYSTGLASAEFSTGPGASWVIKKGTYKFVSSP
jgi:Tfp pilus assembly protein PilX